MTKAKANDVVNEYWADKHRFADLMNGTMFQGRQVLRAEDLQELDSAYPTTIKKKDSYSLTRYRDIVKMAAYGAEYLSCFYKSDQLIPIITVTLYYGEQTWDGPTSLLDMMKVDEKLREYVNDYRINLVSVRDMTNWQVFRTEVAHFFQLMNSLKDIDALHRYVEEHPDMEIDIETISATAVAADSKDLLRLAEQNKI